MKERHGRYASWAVWAPATDTPKSGMDDLRVLDPDQNPTLLQILKDDVVMLGLNVSQDVAEPAPFHNFHHGGRFQDYKTRYAFTGTRYWGAYMTDLIKDMALLEQKALLRYLRDNPSRVGENVDTLLGEFDDLRCGHPTILAFGAQTHRLARVYVPPERYSRLIAIRHYSDYIAPETYRQEVLIRIGAVPHTA